MKKQRLWQIKRKAEGLFKTCGKPQFMQYSYCHEHYLKRKAYNKSYRAKYYR